MLQECTLGLSRVLVSISIKYITIILARVVQVDAFYCESLSCYICVVMVVGCCTSCVELEYLVFLTRITVMQGLLWATCTGHHWLIALRIMIGATYGSVTASSMGSLYCDLSATPWR